MRRSIGTIAASFLALAIALVVNQGALAEQYLTIYHIDVGQGDATLIIAPSGRTLLVDGGDRGKGNRNIVPLLQALGIVRLDYVIASHYHADHIGGLDEVINILADVPSDVLDRGTDGHKLPSTKTYTQYVTSAGTSRKPAALGRSTIDLGDGISTSIVAANAKVLDRNADDLSGHSDENAGSVAVVLNYGDFDYFVGGDLTGGGVGTSTKDLETLVAGVTGNVDIVQINHHGSHTSSNETFLRILDPEVVVISVGNGGSNRSKYHHPRREILDRLHLMNREASLRHIFMTNRGETDGGLLDRDRAIMTIAQGNVVVHASKKHYTVNGKIFATDGALSRAAPPAQDNQ